MCDQRLTRGLLAAAAALGFTLLGCSDAQQSGVDPVMVAQSDETNPTTAVADQPATTPTTGEPGPTTAMSALPAPLSAPEAPPPDPEDRPAERPPTASLPEVPPIEDLDVQLENSNSRDDDLGKLCWARWEVARHLLASLQGPEAEESAYAELSSQIPVVTDTIDGIEALSPELDAFVARFATDLAEARPLIAPGADASTAMTELIRLFAFESYPGVASYAAIAQDHPACSNV